MGQVISKDDTSNDATTKQTRALLFCRVVAGPLYIIMGVIEILTRPGFDPMCQERVEPWGSRLDPDQQLHPDGYVGSPVCSRDEVGAASRSRRDMGTIAHWHLRGGFDRRRHLSSRSRSWFPSGCPGRHAHRDELARHAAQYRFLYGVPFSDRGLFRLRPPLHVPSTTGMGNLLRRNRYRLPSLDCPGDKYHQLGWCPLRSRRGGCLWMGQRITGFIDYEK